MTLVRGSNPIWFEVDLTAHAFDDTFYLFILENEIPYIPATTWQDPFGNIPWSNPIRFLANGTLPNNIYYDPDVVYRLEFRQGPTQEDPLIYLVENYVPGQGGSQPIDEVSFSTDNQISNPQFSVINFVSPLTLSSITTQVINVAPDWFLNLTGTGTVTLTQVTLNSEVENPTNASYALQIQLSGSWTNAYLSQRFKDTGVLWSNTYVSSNIMALSGNAPQNISAILVDSQGNTIANVLDTTPLTEIFNAYPGVDLVDASIDTDFPPDAYIEYRLLLPNNCNITLSSIQLISSDVAVEYPYEQTTIERQTDQLFHFYQPKLDFKPIPSLLVGWDFPLNPAQFGNTGNITTTPGYIWDQTIAYSRTTSLAYARNTIIGGLDITTGGTPPDAFLLCQYISGAAAKKIIGTKLSVNLNAFCGVSGVVTYNIYLFRGSSTAVIPTLPNLIGGLSANGVFTLNSTSGQGLNWTEIPSSNLSPASGLLTAGDYSDPVIESDYGFSGWEITDPTQISDTDKFCIIVTFSYATQPTLINIDSISLVPGEIPTRPAPQTFDEVLRECQHYYEKSYAVNTAPATNTTTNQKLISMNSLTINGSNNAAAYATPFELDYSAKRTTPNLTLYTPSGTSGSVLASLNYLVPTTLVFTTATASAALATFWAAPVIGTNKSSYFPISGTSLASTTNASNSNQFSSASIAYHFVADARLGIV